MRFHISHIVHPASHTHGLLGYQEIIQTLQWGLTSLGHEATAGRNEFRADAVNIVLGFQMLGAPHIQSLPNETIIYNLEQLAGIPLQDVPAVVANAARKFIIWDYDPRNLEAWGQFQPAHPPVLLPIGWAPTLAQVPQREQDIDVLFYGFPAKTRLEIFQALCDSGIHAIFACGFYGPQRDELIARSKLVLNINRHQHSRVFEIVRVSYLLANGKAVVSDIYPKSRIDPELKDAVAFAPLEQVVATCLQLLSDEPARRQLESRGRAWMEKRDIRPMLEQALAATALK